MDFLLFISSFKYGNGILNKSNNNLSKNKNFEIIANKPTSPCLLLNALSCKMRLNILSFMARSKEKAKAEGRRWRQQSQLPPHGERPESIAEEEENPMGEKQPI